MIEKQQQAMRPAHMQDIEIAGINACYDVSLRIEPSDLKYSGELHLAFLNDTENAIDELVFRLYPNTTYNYAGSLAAVRADIQGQEAAFITTLPDQSVLHLPFPGLLLPGDAIEIAISFTGQIPENSTTYGIYNFDPDVMTIALANSFPILASHIRNGWGMEEIQPFGDAVTSDTSLFHVTIEMPQDWQIATSGIALSVSQHNGSSISEFVSGPMRDFMIVASPNFTVYEEISEGVTIRQWALPDNESEQAAALETVSQATILFSNLYGEYPYNEMDIVSIHLNNASGVEYPGLILMEQMLYPPNSHDLNRLAMVIAHEVAHQWWYALVGNDVQNDPWLDESLATYASLVYMDSINPDYGAGARQFFREAVTTFENSLKPPGYRIADPLIKYRNDSNAYALIVYRKGALFLDALNKEIGQEVFSAALVDYFTQNKFQLAEPASFLNVFEARCECDLTAFYKEWGILLP